MGELGESTAEGEPNSAADCGSAMEVAEGSGAMVTVVCSLERPGMGWAAGSFGGGAETGLCCAPADEAAKTAVSAMIERRISTLLPARPILAEELTVWIWVRAAENHRPKR
jgi:hypothetical protein